MCDADAFSSGRVRREIERILSKHPLKDKASEVKVRCLLSDEQLALVMFVIFIFVLGYCSTSE